MSAWTQRKCYIWSQPYPAAVGKAEAVPSLQPYLAVVLVETKNAQDIYLGPGADPQVSSTLATALSPSFAVPSPVPGFSIRSSVPCSSYGQTPLSGLGPS